MPLLLPFLGSFLGVVASFPLQMLVFRHQRALARIQSKEQRERDNQERQEQRVREDLAYKRATSDRIRSILFPAYQTIQTLISAYDSVHFEVRTSRDSLLEAKKEDLTAAIQEADKALATYILIHKEDEIRKAISALRMAHNAWTHAYRELKSAMKEEAKRPIIKELPDGSLQALEFAHPERVKEAFDQEEEDRKEYEKRKLELQEIASSWNEELP